MSRKRRMVVKNLKPDTLIERKVTRANLMLKQLKKAGIKENTWASKKLYDRLSGGKVNVIDKKGTINIKNKKLTKGSKRVIVKALDNFFKSETSTPAGIEDVRTRTIKSLRATLSGVDNKLSYDEAEALYNMLGDNDFDYFVDKIGASEMWAMLDDSVDADDDETTYLIRMGTIIENVNDDDVKEKLLRIYNKYVI